MASGLIWVIAALVGIFAILECRKRWLTAVSAFVSAFTAWCINRWIGEIFFRPRPFAVYTEVQRLIEKSPLEKSFPSDHSATVFALAFSVFLVNRRWGVVLLTLAGGVALGRVFVGVHFLTDVLAGAFIGVLCAYLIHRLVHKVLGTKHHQPKV